MAKLSDIYIPVIKQAQQLGLLAPCFIKSWDKWWQETTYYYSSRLPVIRISRQLLNPLRRIKVLAYYKKHGGETTAADLFAHELGHVFRHTWIRNQKVAPLGGYREVFGRNNRFKDPWNDMQDYLSEHPNTELDTNRYLTWYAWADHEEDFCECFAELLLSEGDIAPYRDRPGVYRKLKFIQAAGRKILGHNPILRSCNRRGQILLSTGEISFKCPMSGQKYGVPDVQDTYRCPCGIDVVHDGDWITHKQ